MHHEPELPFGTPVVARMGGPSNELLLDGLIAGPWRRSQFTDWDWSYEIAVTWSRHISFGVRARDVLGEMGVVRSSHVGLTVTEWAAVQRARLSRATSEMHAHSDPAPGRSHYATAAALAFHGRPSVLFDRVAGDGGHVPAEGPITADACHEVFLVDRSVVAPEG